MFHSSIILLFYKQLKNQSWLIGSLITLIIFKQVFICFEVIYFDVLKIFLLLIWSCFKFQINKDFSRSYFYLLELRTLKMLINNINRLRLGLLYFISIFNVFDNFVKAFDSWLDILLQPNQLNSIWVIAFDIIFMKFADLTLIC